MDGGVDGTTQRRVVQHEFLLYQHRADVAFQQHEEECGQGGAEHSRIALAARPEDEDQREDAAEAARQAMAEFDDGLRPWRGRNDLAIAEWPMIAATGAGTGDPHPGAEQNHGYQIGHEEPGELAETLTLH